MKIAESAQNVSSLWSTLKCQKNSRFGKSFHCHFLCDPADLHFQDRKRRVLWLYECIGGVGELYLHMCVCPRYLFILSTLASEVDSGPLDASEPIQTNISEPWSTTITLSDLKTAEVGTCSHGEIHARVRDVDTRELSSDGSFDIQR